MVLVAEVKTKVAVAHKRARKGKAHFAVIVLGAGVGRVCVNNKRFGRDNDRQIGDVAAHELVPVAPRFPGRGEGFKHPAVYERLKLGRGSAVNHENFLRVKTARRMQHCCHSVFPGRVSRSGAVVNSVAVQVNVSVINPGDAVRHFVVKNSIPIIVI